MKNLLNKIFKIEENQTTIRTEIIAGVTTFFAMCYIVVVNPAQVAAGGAACYSITWDSSYRKYLYSDTLLAENRVRHGAKPNILYVDSHVAPTEKAPYWGMSATSQREWVIFWYYQNSKPIN